MPLLVALIRYSTFNSKSAGSPPRQMMNVFSFSGLSAVVWPTIAPPSARQNFVSPSQPFNVDPSKIETNPA